MISYWIRRERDTDIGCIRFDFNFEGNRGRVFIRNGQSPVGGLIERS